MLASGRALSADRLTVKYDATEVLRHRSTAGRMAMSEPARRLELFTGSGQRQDRDRDAIDRMISRPMDFRRVAPATINSSAMTSLLSTSRSSLYTDW